MMTQNHLLRTIDKAIDWNFIYDLVEERKSRQVPATRKGGLYGNESGAYVYMPEFY